MSPFLFVGWLAIAGDLQAEEAETQIRVQCNAARTVCAVAHDDLAALVIANNLKADEITKLRDQLKKLGESKGCAKLEVLPPLKKERDL